VECVNAWIEERFGVPRRRSALLVIGSIAVLSTLSILSYNVLAGLNFGGRNINASLDYFSNQILLPLGGLLIAIFAGWFVKRDASQDELTSLHHLTYGIWRFLIRFVVPPALAIIFVMGVGG
jgi:NSS family neurotransmitter:Na+ symporter